MDGFSRMWLRFVPPPLNRGSPLNKTACAVVLTRERKRRSPSTLSGPLSRAEAAAVREIRVSCGRQFRSPLYFPSPHAIVFSRARRAGRSASDFSHLRFSGEWHRFVLARQHGHTASFTSPPSPPIPPRLRPGTLPEEVLFGGFFSACSGFFLPFRFKHWLFLLRFWHVLAFFPLSFNSRLLSADLTSPCPRARATLMFF